MRFVIRLLILVAVLWCGWWVLGQQGISRGLDAWLEQRRAEGWQAEAKVETGGFPIAWRTILTDVALADPDTGLAWHTPALSLSAPVYTPTRVTATLPVKHTISSPLEKIEVTAGVMESHLGLVPGPDLVLDESLVTLNDVTLTGSTGWTAALAQGSLSTRRAEDTPLAHDISFLTTDFRPSKDAVSTLDPAGLLPPVISEMALDARIAFDAPWDRHAIEDRRPQITSLNLSRLSAQWGDMALEATGTVTVDPEGIPEGRITIRATNWRDMVEIGRSTGLIPEGIAPTIERALEILAGLSGSSRTIDAPLSFQKGNVSLGPIPLGPAPRLIIR